MSEPDQGSIDFKLDKETYDLTGDISDNELDPSPQYADDVGRTINNLRSRVFSTWRVEEKNRLTDEILQVATQECDLYPIFETVDAAVSLYADSNNRNRAAGKKLMEDLAHYLSDAGGDTPLTKVFVESVPSEKVREDVFLRSSQIYKKYQASPLKSDNLAGIFSDYFVDGAPAHTDQLYVGIHNFQGRMTNMMLDKYQEAFRPAYDELWNTREDFTPENVDRLLTSLQNLEGLQSNELIRPVLKCEFGLPFSLENIFQQEDPAKAREMADEFRKNIPKGNYFWKHLADIMLSPDHLDTIREEYKKLQSATAQLTTSPNADSETKSEDKTSSDLVADTPPTEPPESTPEEKGEPLAKLDKINAKLESLVGIIPVERDEILKTVRGFRKTYSNLIPDRFKNSRWQGEEGHTVRMDVNTFNWQIGFEEVGVVGYPGSGNMKQGWIPFTLRMGNDAEKFEGVYSFKDGTLVVAEPKAINATRIEESEKPILHNFITLNVLGAFMTTLMGQGEIRPEVARHQIQKTMEYYKVDDSKKILALSLFNNRFPPLYALVSDKGLDTAERETEIHPDVEQKFGERVEEIKSAIPKDPAKITEVFENNPQLTSLFKELDGGHAITFSKDGASDNLVFSLIGESDNTTVINGRISKGGELVDFDLDLEKYPKLKEYFRGFILTKYVQVLQEQGVIPKEVKATEEYLIEPLGTPQKISDVVPRGTFDEIETMVREDMKEGEDVKRLENRLGYMEYMINMPELQGFRDYTETHKRRLWTDIPARYKTGRWMKEDQVYTSATYSAGLMNERNVDITYLFSKNPETDSIAYVRVDADHDTEPRVTLQSDGSITCDGIDMSQYPSAKTHDESTAIEAYFRMLEDNKEARMSDSTTRSIATLIRNNKALIDKFYELDNRGELYEQFLASKSGTPPMNQDEIQPATLEKDSHELVIQRLAHLEQLYQTQPHADVLEVNNTKRRRMWMDIPTRFKSGRWMEEGKIYSCESFRKKGETLDKGVDQEMTFERDPETDSIICTFKRVMEGGTLIQRSILQPDGSIQIESVDQQNYLHAIDAESDIAVEAYFKTLEQEGLTEMSDTLRRSLFSLQRRTAVILRDYKNLHPDWIGAEYPSFEDVDSSSDIDEQHEKKRPEDAIYFLSGGDIGEGGLSKDFGEEYARLHRKYYQDLWKFVPTTQKNGRWIPEGRALKGSTVNGTDANKFIEFTNKEDSEEISFSYHGLTKDGNPLQIDGTIGTNGKISIPDIDSEEFLGTFDALNSQVVFGYLDLLMARHAVRRTKEMGQVVAKYQKDFDELMSQSVVEETNSSSKEETPHASVEVEKSAEDVITALIARVKEEAGEELFKQFTPELNKMRRRFWINTPERYKTNKWIPDGKVYNSSEWEKGNLHSGAKILGLTNITFAKDPSSERILTKASIGDEELELFINRNGSVDVPGVDLSKFGDDIEILQSGIIESYFTVLYESRFVTYNDSLTRGLAQVSRVLSRLNEGKPPSPTDGKTVLQPPFRSLEDASLLNEYGEQNREELRQYNDFVKQTMGGKYIEFLTQSDELAKKVWQAIPSHLRIPNWIQGEKKSYEAKFTDNSASTSIDMRAVSFYHLQNFDLDNISNALTATIIFKNDHFDNKSLFMLQQDGSIVYPTVDIKETEIEAIAKRAIYQGYYKALVLAKRIQSIPELDTEIDEFEARFGTVLSPSANTPTTETSQAKGIALSSEQIQVNSERSMKRYDSIIDTLNPDEKTRIEELADKLRDGIWNSMSEKARMGPDLTEHNDVFTMSTPPLLQTFIYPYDTFTLAANKNKYRGFFYGFTTSDLKDGVTFWQNTDGEIVFDEKLPDTPGVKIAKLSALSLYADVMKARGEYDDSALSEEHKKNREEFAFLFNKAIDTFNIKEAEGETHSEFIPNEITPPPNFQRILSRIQSSGTERKKQLAEEVIRDTIQGRGDYYSTIKVIDMGLTLLASGNKGDEITGIYLFGSIQDYYDKARSEVPILTKVAYPVEPGKQPDGKEAWASLIDDVKRHTDRLKPFPNLSRYSQYALEALNLTSQFSEIYNPYNLIEFIDFNKVAAEGVSTEYLKQFEEQTAQLVHDTSFTRNADNALTKLLSHLRSQTGPENLKPFLTAKFGSDFSIHDILVMEDTTEAKLQADIFCNSIPVGDYVWKELTTLLLKNNLPLAQKAYAEIKDTEPQPFQVDLEAASNPQLLFREDTHEFIKLQDIKAFPEKKEKYEDFVRTHVQKAWSFVPPAFQNSAGINKGSILSFNLATNRENDPFKGTSLWIQHAPEPNDNRLYFSMNNPNPTIKGYINPDGTIEVPDLDPDKFRDGLNFLNLSIIQWYLGALEPKKVVDAVAFGKYWEEYKNLREESFFDCLVNLSPIQAEEPTNQTSPGELSPDELKQKTEDELREYGIKDVDVRVVPENGISDEIRKIVQEGEQLGNTQKKADTSEGVEKTPRKRLKPGEAGQELERVFDQLLQELAKSNTMES